MPFKKLERLFCILFFKISKINFMIEPKPYKLFNKIQNYDWGTKNENAFIPNLLGIKAEQNIPYAELWIGAHPKASSEIVINEKKYLLNELIEKYPNEILGKETSEKFNNKLPFLLKILSAEKALSIQTHPNKEQAEQLHKIDPSNYPDNNHKPEIAIAVDSLKAVAGFRPVMEIIVNLKSNPELKLIGGEELFNKILNAKNEKEQKEFLKEFYSSLMKKENDNEILKNVIGKIDARLSNKKNLTHEEEQFLKQYKIFGYDVGLFSFFFFNMLNLKPGQAIYTEAGAPHAYLEGNIIECMANSDNVVRAGLTNKYKDVKTLLNIIRYDFEKYKIINEESESGEVFYKTSADEFEIILNEKKIDFSKKYINENKPLIVLVLKGLLKIKNDKNAFEENYKKGESFLVPAVVKEFELTCLEESKFVIAQIPSA